MGNCWRMPEDHSGLLHISPSTFSILPNSSSAIPSSTSTSYLTFMPTNSDSSDTNTPKVIQTNPCVCLWFLFFEIVLVSNIEPFICRS